ncbi:MAG: flap endonuclease [Candidatus Diapherotrites archaeon]|nr:flap endonuclease [Candidatus Diapherotrites archaeon]MDN5366646.1 flap endonuclease [Candidatus Diapherotrites archaeon]
MGVALGDIIPRHDIPLDELRAKKIALDAYNALYQFLSAIRQPDGTPLMDRKGRITSHLSGLFYRTIKLMELGVQPVYVFDGTPPELKMRTIEQRKAAREEAERKWEEALEKGDIEEARKYAQAAHRLTKEMVEDAKRLLDAMGVPYVQAPSEGEAQAAYMAAKGDVWASGSQDYDSLLFGTPRLIRNLTIVGKRKLPGKDVYVDVPPEKVELEEVLRTLGIDRRKLVWIGILIGTDFNEKVPGIGPKRALALVKEYDSLEEIFKAIGYRPNFDWIAVERIFLEPDVTDDYRIAFRRPDREKIFEILVEEHDFSPERVERAVQRLEEATPASGAQTSLDAWFG